MKPKLNKLALFLYLFYTVEYKEIKDWEGNSKNKEWYTKKGLYLVKRYWFQLFQFVFALIPFLLFYGLSGIGRLFNYCGNNYYHHFTKTKTEVDKLTFKTKLFYLEYLWKQ